jgi:hypothetical protein
MAAISLNYSIYNKIKNIMLILENWKEAMQVLMVASMEK